jgi:hypothetical protein
MFYGFHYPSVSSACTASIGDFECLFHFVSYILLWVLGWSFYSFVFISGGKIGPDVLLRFVPAISSLCFPIIDRILWMKFVDFGWPGQN